MKQLQLSSRKAIVAAVLALSLFLPAMARAEAECITETITVTYYVFGIEVWQAKRSYTVCVEWVAR